MKTLSKKEKLDMPFAVKVDGLNSFKEIDTTQRTVDVIANTYYWFDSDGDVLIPGCAVKSIQERGPDSKLPGKIKHLSNHDLHKAIGRIEKLEETKFEGMDVLRANSYMSETDLGEETLVKYNEGLIDQHSIGFRYMDLQFLESESEEFDAMLSKLINPEDAIDAGYLYVVRELKLWEFSSLDGFGSNRLTPYLGSKSENVTVQYNNLIAKHRALVTAIKNGGDKGVIELQNAQIEQMLYELYNREPGIKDTLIKPSKKTTFNMLDTINNHKF